MRILYITDGGPGGVSSHVRCLTQCLKDVAEVMVCITYGSDALKKMLDEDGTPYCWCRCRNGHDLRLLLKVRRLIREFRPEVIHFHDIPLLVALYVKILRWSRRWRGIGVVSTIHTPSAAHHLQFSRAAVNWAVEPCYWLPVSGPNWRNFKTRYPKARGEVFYNPIRIGNREQGTGNGEQGTGNGDRGTGNREQGTGIGKSNNPTIQQSNNFVVGMVGRNADQKDWPSFHKVEELVKDKVSGLQGFKDEKFNVVRGEMAPFCRTADALKWARSHGLIGRMEDPETGGKGVVTISAESIREALNPRQREKSVSQVLHFAALMKLRELIRESRILESHSDWRKDAAGIRTPLAGVNNEVEICVAYAAFGIGEEIYRVRLTLKRYAQTGTSKVYAYRVNEIEVAPGTLGGKIALTTSPTGTTSICGAILLNGVYDVNGVPEFLNAGEKEVCDGREAIGKMDLFVMTSKHEQLPTTVLECFALGTPICGFLPEGGTSDILQFSNGPLREVFIKERDCEKLADIVLDLLMHPEKRQALVEDGWQILVNHFDAEKNCKGRLMEIYKNCLIV